jgi:uracil-DNA glycosylase family 4
MKGNMDRRRGERALAEARAAVVACERCPRLRAYCRQVAREKRRAYRDDTYWARPVPGFGDSSARLVIVGLAPAAHGANRTGRMFTGDGAGGSGDFLMAALHRAGFANLATSRDTADGLTLDGAFITAAVRCAPPDNKPTAEEAEACLPHLEAEFSALGDGRVIVALGRIAFDACLRLYRRRGFSLAPAPKFAHGSSTGLPDGRLLLGCYHPSRQNTHTGRLTATMMDEVFQAARRAI